MRSNDTHEGTLVQIARGPEWANAQQLRIAFDSLTVTLAASVACAFAVVLLLWPVVDNRGLILWLGGISVLTLARLTLLQRYQRMGGEGTASKRWQRGFVGATLLSGLSWGCLSVFLFPVDSLIHQAYLAFVLGGICAGAVSAYAPVKGAFACFSVPTLAPYAVEMMLHNGSAGYVMAGLIIAFQLGLMRSARDSRKSVEYLLELQVKNADLARALHHRATHDGLVNLVNQSEFNRRLQRLASENRRDDGEYSLIFIDLDLFKEVNDTGGHAAGDLILQAVANVIRRNTRGGDTAARVGGDEFAAILEGCPHQRAVEIAEKIRTDIETLQVSYEGREYSVRASIGVSYGIMGKHSASGMLKAADAACYAAKESGRNRVHENAANENVATTDRFQLTQALSTASLAV